MLALCADPALDLPPGIGLPLPHAAPSPSQPQALNGFPAPCAADTGACGVVRGAQLRLLQGFAGDSTAWGAAAVAAGMGCPGGPAGVGGPEAVGSEAAAGQGAPVLAVAGAGLGTGAPMPMPAGLPLAAQLAGPAALAGPVAGLAGPESCNMDPAGAAGTPAPHAGGVASDVAGQGCKPAQMGCGHALVVSVGSGGALLQALRPPPAPTGLVLFSPGQVLGLPAGAADGALILPPLKAGPGPSPGVRLQPAAVALSDRRGSGITNPSAGPAADEWLPAADPGAAGAAPSQAAAAGGEQAAAEKRAPGAHDLAPRPAAAECSLPAQADGGRPARAEEGERPAAVEQKVAPEQHARTVLKAAAGAKAAVGRRAANGQREGISAIGPPDLAGAKRRAIECEGLQAEPDVAAKRARLVALRCAAGSATCADTYTAYTISGDTMVR